MSDTQICPFCSVPMKPMYLYVRGIFVSLHRSTRSDVGFFSRSDLQQIDLDAISHTDAGSQAVISALRCESCDSIIFKST